MNLSVSQLCQLSASLQKLVNQGENVEPLIKQYKDKLTFEHHLTEGRYWIQPSELDTSKTEPKRLWEKLETISKENCKVKEVIVDGWNAPIPISLIVETSKSTPLSIDDITDTIKIHFAKQTINYPFFLLKKIPYFESMLSSNMKEAVTKEVTFDEITKEIFDKVIEYVQNNSHSYQPPNDLLTLVDLFLASSYLQIEPLRKTLKTKICNCDGYVITDKNIVLWNEGDISPYLRVLDTFDALSILGDGVSPSLSQCLLEGVNNNTPSEQRQELQHFISKTKSEISFDKQFKPDHLQFIFSRFSFRKVKFEEDVRAYPTDPKGIDHLVVCSYRDVDPSLISNVRVITTHKCADPFISHFQHCHHLEEIKLDFFSDLDTKFIEAVKKLPKLKRIFAYYKIKNEKNVFIKIALHWLKTKKNATITLTNNSSLELKLEQNNE